MLPALRLRAVALATVAASFALFLPAASPATVAAVPWTATATVSSTSVARGTNVTFTVQVASSTATSALVDLEVYSGSGVRNFYQVWDSQAFTANVTRTFTSTWTVPAGEPLDVHSVKVGIFAPGWTSLFLWNGSAASFTVKAAAPPTTTTTATTTTTTTTTTTVPPTTTTVPPTTTTTTTTVPPTTTTTTVPGAPWTGTATAGPSSISRGTVVTFTVKVTSNTTKSALVDLELYGASQGKVFYQVWDNQPFVAGVMRTFTATWTVPAGEALDAHYVKLGVFAPGWTSLYLWKDASSFVVTAPTTTTTAPTTTTMPSTTTTVAPTTTTTVSSSGLPALPAGWPTGMQLGQADGLGGAAATRAVAPFGFQYQYLSGGVNTGGGWSTWNPNGTFVTNYANESHANGMIPVFSYYMIFQSSPGGSMGEPAGIYANINNSSTMTAYYNDLKLFFQRAADAGGKSVLQVEPDLWAYLQQQATNDDAHTVAMKVGSSGQADVAGLPDNAAGFGQAIARLRDRYAPNVDIGFHFSSWAVGGDWVYSDPSDAVVDSLGVRNARFYLSMGAHFNIAFNDFSDRDAAYKQYVYGDNGASWWNADDYRRSTVFISAFVRVARLRVVVWQIPQGNTKMRAENNTNEHYQDNKVEWLLEDPSRAHLTAYANAGVVAFLFGRGADGPTCACDAANDGVTNPAPINGNNRVSLNADDDGGYWKERAPLYYQTGIMPLP